VYAGAKSRLRTLQVKQRAENAKRKSPMSALPQELQTHIAAHLDLASLKKLRLTSKSLAGAGRAANQFIVVRNRKELAQALKTFELGGLTGVTLMGESFTDEDLKSLPRSLKQLSMKGCSKITNEGMAFLPKSLTHLMIKNVPRIDNAGFSHLQDMPLQKLALRACSRIKNDGLLYLNKKTLRDLDLVGCTEIDDSGLAHLSGTQLKRLVLGNSDGITDAGIAHLQGLPLKYLDVTDLTNVRAPNSELKNLFPACEVVRGFRTTDLSENAFYM
jgi:hypothetical protein